MYVSDIEARAAAVRVEEQLASLESVNEPGARVVRAAALDAIGSLLELYGAGLARILTIIVDRTDPAIASALNKEFARDEVVGHLLLVHGLHPDPVDERVGRAIARLGDERGNKKGQVEVVAVTETVATLRVIDAGEGCHSTAPELQRLAEEAVLAAAPELSRVDVEIISAEDPVVLVPLQHHHSDNMSFSAEARA